LKLDVVGEAAQLVISQPTTTLYAGGFVFPTVTVVDSVGQTVTNFGKVGTAFGGAQATLQLDPSSQTSGVFVVGKTSATSLTGSYSSGLLTFPTVVLSPSSNGGTYTFDVLVTGLPQVTITLNLKPGTGRRT
jgi:hypothetical protein